MSIAADQVSAVPSAATDSRGIGGHPRGLSTLFFTEMWERFSFYGMKAILILYIAAPLALGGLAMSAKTAGMIVGTYTSSVYMTPLIGGWLADKVFGTRRAVLLGGIIIACGHFSMAVPSLVSFYLGLTLITLGTGLLKPNISAMVGQLYVSGDVRRDAGFSIFYMGINLGALLSPLVCGFLAQDERFQSLLRAHHLNPANSWHWGFAAAGVGMVFGLIQYVFSGDRLKGIGLKPKAAASDRSSQEGARRDFLSLGLAAIGGAVGGVGAWFAFGHDIAATLLLTAVGAAVGYILGVMRDLERDQIKRVAVIFVLSAFSIVFWSSFEQAATSLNLFADRLTRTSILGHAFPSSWFQSVQPTFVILLAPVFAAVWVKLGRHDPSSPAKFAFGLLFAASAFGLVAFASTFTAAGKVSPWWLVGVFFLQTLGELCLSPVGLSTVTKLSPAKLVGLMMGVWFLCTACSELVAGWASRFLESDTKTALVSQLVHLFGGVAAITVAAAVLLFLLTPLIKKLTPRVT